ncbi:hypothetical protein [Curtobacterium sp. MCSS17_005]|uniref:hypothetical protein n=1 Tax=Curtobacterium sp. MCSS17_005 TaxID=2175641 RepID=UPI000DA6F7E1|nr:hypothetical protein [Curtobacterium sp. MCSS17_005]WIB31437.1 hypothetical protein DEJ20_10415 [Curtobacterium sp. MCSS17_005]
MTTPRTKQHELAEATRQQYQRRVDEIRNDRRFTPEAKQQVIAKLYRDTNHQLGQLRDERDATLSSRRTALEAEMFGLPKYASTSDTLSYRDALDRASRAEDGAALAALYDTAAISNDTILAKAILAKAYGDGEVDVINRYLEDHSILETKAQELWDIRYGDEAAGQTLQNTLNDFAFQADKPTEIRALSDSLIEQVAEASE